MMTSTRGSVQELFDVSRIGLDWVRSGRVGSGQEVSNSHGSGSVTVTRPDPT